jgi:predicted Zn-dependent peptidase
MLPEDDIEAIQLGNGLRILVSADRSLPLVGVHLRYPVGSRHDGPEQHGLAHLFEHLMFAGTASIGRGQHPQLVQSAGGNVNATTSTDWTSYTHVVGPEALEMVLWLEAERLRGLPAAMDAVKIETEVRVVRSERSLQVEDAPYGHAVELIAAAAFPDGHPYQHLPIGRPEHLERVSVGDVNDFFTRHYTPDRAVLALTGDVDPAAAFALAARHLGTVQGGRRAPAPPPPVARAGVHHRVAIERASPRDPRLFIGVLLPPTSSDDYDRCRAVAMLLAGGSGGWLARRLGQRHGLIADARIRLMSQAVHASLAVIELIPRDGASLAAIEDAYRAELEDLAAAGVDGEELGRAVALHTSRCLARRDRAGGRADELSLYGVISPDPGLRARAFARAESMEPADAAPLIRAFAGAGDSVVLRYVR